MDTNISCTRRIQFCAGHRLAKHESKCSHLHGHNYVVHITAEADSLDHVGRVIDFSVLKDKIGGWIDRHWDHGFLVAEDDRGTLNLMASAAAMWDQKYFLMPYSPTAENIARYLLEVVCPDLLREAGVRVVAVSIEETENCSAFAFTG